MSKLVQIQYDTNCYDSYDSQTCQTCSEHIWYELIQLLNMSRLEIKTWRNTQKFEQMAHKKAKGQQAEKLFLGSLRASRAIKNLQFLKHQSM